MSEAIKLAIEALEAALSEDQPYIVKCKFALAALRAQPDHIVDANGMVDHSELVKRLRYYATRGMDAYVVAADCDRAADALEAIGIQRRSSIT